MILEAPKTTTGRLLGVTGACGRQFSTDARSVPPADTSLSQVDAQSCYNWRKVISWQPLKKRISEVGPPVEIGHVEPPLVGAPINLDWRVWMFTQPTPNGIAINTAPWPLLCAGSTNDAMQLLTSNVTDIYLCNMRSGAWPVVLAEERWRWFGDALRDDGNGEHVRALGHIFRPVGELLSNGQFREVDEWLSSLEPSRLSANLIVGILSITRAASDRLLSRPKFFDDACAAVERKGRDAGKFLGALKGRRPPYGAPVRVGGIRHF
jgi:hypothetical protein